ncbi:hypothetical protein [Streptomyces sp. NPDC054786]
MPGTADHPTTPPAGLTAHTGSTAQAGTTLPAGSTAHTGTAPPAGTTPHADCLQCGRPTEYPVDRPGIVLCPVCEWQEAQRSACSG